MTDLTRQQLCAALGISESTVRRLELKGIPFTPVGIRSKRYNIDEVKQWLRANQSLVSQRETSHTYSSLPKEGAFSEACRKVRLRVYPSKD
jgi:excisionase family DNA binding protein